MAYDETLADRVRTMLSVEQGVTERRMFGGICFLVHGHMVAGVLGSDVILKVGSEAYAAALERRHVRPFDFTGRPSRGTVFVGASAVITARALRAWLAPVVARVKAMPPKRRGATPRR